MSPHHSRMYRCSRIAAAAAFSVVSILAATPSPAQASLLAYSLAEAERRVSAGRASEEVATLGGIRNIVGAVRDERTGDVIIVGHVGNGGIDGASRTLDDLAIALRALLRLHRDPLVSIDRTADTEQTGNQTIRMEGGIHDSRFGLDLLAADVVLKNLALGKLPTDVWGFRSYFDRSLDAVETRGSADIFSRFWFHLDTQAVSLAIRQNVAALRDVRIRLSTQHMSGSNSSGPSQDLAAEGFATDLSGRFEALTVAHPELRRMVDLIRVSALATGIAEIAPEKELGFWLDRYRIAKVPTPTVYPLVERTGQASANGEKMTLRVSGGVRLPRAIVRRLRDGDITALRSAVLSSRPDRDALTWRLPIDAWDIPGGFVNASDTTGEAMAAADMPGTTMLRQYLGAGSASPSAGALPASYRPQQISPRTADRLASMGNLGGILLEGELEGVGSDASIALNITNRRFNLVVDGRDVEIAPESFRRFVTALWAVYFTNQAPGISIDPIAPGADRQLVRYIGKVMRSDLGRVMREADYAMKAWAVGPERPEIPKFEDIDQLTGRLGANTRNVLRRFWFVPENLTFDRGSSGLLYRNGGMSLKTEYAVQGLDLPPEPADKAFAEFFTANYDQIAIRHPVFAELRDYAKFVVLAQFLKRNGVPLFWFLMANRDLVLAEDDPAGSVPTLHRPSKTMPDTFVEGGVDLGANASYVLDAETIAALRAATPKRSAVSPKKDQVSNGKSPTGKPATEFQVAPALALVDGGDRRGGRYHTDIAVRERTAGVQGGIEPGLELVRVRRPVETAPGLFGEGWDLLLPYRVAWGLDGKVNRNGLVAPRSMQLSDLVTGRVHRLSIETERFTSLAYVPDTRDSGIVAVLPLNDGSFVVEDRLGNRFELDRHGRTTAMRFSPEYQVNISYSDDLASRFDVPPYRVEVVDGALSRIGHYRVVAEIRVVDFRGDEVARLRAAEIDGAVGYRPTDAAGPLRHGQLLADGRLILRDVHDNTMIFGRDGRLRAFEPPSGAAYPASLTKNGQEISFRYRLDGKGRPAVSQATLVGSVRQTVRYRQDQEGRLASIM